MLPQEPQMPAGRYFSGCLQSGSAPLQPSRRIQTLTCLSDPNPWTGMGVVLDSVGSSQLEGKFFFPGRHDVHLPLDSKSLNTQSVLLKCSMWMSKIECRHTYADKEAPQQQPTSAKHKNLLYGQDNSHVTKALCTKLCDILL